MAFAARLGGPTEKLVEAVTGLSSQVGRQLLRMLFELLTDYYHHRINLTGSRMFEMLP